MKHHSTISNKQLFSYFLPELITTFVLYIGLEIIDFRFIACTNIASCNATLVITNTLFHLITKIAEGFSVGMVIMCGQYNGAHEYEKTGQMVTDAFWTTALVGGGITLFLMLGSSAIYTFYEVPEEIMSLGIPFLRLRAVGVFFSFMYFALIGFLRGIKNPKIPMALFLLGAITFLFFDYALIFGHWGFPALGLQGSALATVIQYSVMLTGALVYILWSKTHRKYSIRLFSNLRWNNIQNLIQVSWPVMMDKASIALYPIWLTKMIACSTKFCELTTCRSFLDSFAVLKTMERISILPALAFAQVITYVVSNDYKVHYFAAITHNIKKIILFTMILVSLFMLAFYSYPTFFLDLLGKKQALNSFLLNALPYIGLIIFFDVIQLLLSGALRGAANVKTVMWARMVITGLFFVPLTYGIYLLPLTNLSIKFLLLYSSVHLSYALMSVVYIYRFKSGQWKKQSIKEA